jgi:hypothetical protein
MMFMSDVKCKREEAKRRLNYMINRMSRREIVALFVKFVNENQTDVELDIGVSKYQNGVGLQRRHAMRGAGIARRYNKVYGNGATHTFDYDDAAWIKKTLPVYAVQLCRGGYI